jgi:hypothetical protein
MKIKTKLTGGRPLIPQLPSDPDNPIPPGRGCG